MSRMIDADAHIDDAMDRYCKDCDKRKGIKNGKWKIVYEIGDVPCRACGVYDMVNDIEYAPTVDAVQVVRCEDCKWLSMTTLGMPYACWHGADTIWGETGEHANHHVCKRIDSLDWFCADGERREDDGNT